MESEVIRLARPRHGHFELGTGYHGDLWLNLDALFLRPARLRPSIRYLAERVAGHRIEAVCGPSDGGAFLAQALADVLDVAFLPACRSPAPGGYSLPSGVRGEIGGWQIALVDDAINAGTAVRACHALLRGAGAVPVAMAALLALGRAPGMFADRLSLPFHAVAVLPGQVWPAGDCPLCVGGSPLTDPVRSGSLRFPNR